MKAIKWLYLLSTFINENISYVGQSMDSLFLVLPLQNSVVFSILSK